VRRRTTAVAIVGILLAVVGSPEAVAAKGRRARVTRAVDGDTVEARVKKRTVDLRLLGIDTPETVHPTQPVGCFGPEASRFTKRKLEGKRVRLEFDKERYDQYDRTLVYIWLNGRLFNRTLVLRGFATVLIYPPNDKYAAQLERAEDLAQAKNRGLWEACKVGGGGSDGGGGGGRCDLSYPAVCIPPPPPDLDCADIEHRNFRVTGSDPHRFDGDSDGFGCET